MTTPEFRPGFRLSAVDVVVLFAGMTASIVLWRWMWWTGFVVAFVVGHFFLFCNVVRLSRPLELLWAAIFVLLVTSTVGVGVPAWSLTIGLSMVASIAVIGIEAHKPSYHGLGWQRLNPRLPEWWESRSNL